MTAEDFFQKDSIAEFLRQLGTEAWFSASSSSARQTELGKVCFGFYCALIPRKRVPGVLQHFGWDLTKGHGLPGFSMKAGRTSYHRFGDDHGIEPLLFDRDYHGLRPGEFEVAEEFRHFHNLFREPSGALLRFDEDDGISEVIGRPVPHGFELRMRDVREFLAARNLYLALYFDISRTAKRPVQKGEEQHEQKIDQEALFSYSFTIREDIARLVGKKLIQPLPKSEIGRWPFTERRKARRAEQHESFIIGRDADGRAVESTCDPEKLDNYFGKNPGAPHYLMPVFFERGVLQYYMDRPELYSVEDGLLRCAGLWALRIDNNHQERVVVALGDLGRDLSKREQHRWKPFNVPPEGGYSEVAFKRGFLAEFTDASRADLRFKRAFEEFQEEWPPSEGWQLLLPLSESDSHFFSALRIPLVENQREFDSQILGLAKLLIDSLNEPELRVRFGAAGDDPGTVRSLVLLTRLLIARGHSEEAAAALTDGLRDLQALRSAGVAHRKGEKYLKAAARVGLNDTPKSQVFSRLLSHGCSVLDALRRPTRQ
jgi:hypothetical protein